MNTHITRKPFSFAVILQRDGIHNPMRKALLRKRPYRAPEWCSGLRHCNAVLRRPYRAPEWCSGLRHCNAVLRRHYSFGFDPRLGHSRP